MIEVKTGTQEDLLEVHMSAPVKDKDYSEVLMPALDAALARVETVRMLGAESGDDRFHPWRAVG
jgi:hypothetical protein